MAKGNQDKGAESTAPEVEAGGLDTIDLFNSTSSIIGIMHGNGGVISIPPFSVVGTPIPRELFDVWSNTVVGQAYLDKGLLCTVKSDKVGYSATSDLVVPLELQAPAAAGGTESELVQPPTLDGGVTLPAG